MPKPEPRTYGIGAVAKMTGLTTHTIRAWENRHEAIAVVRSQSQRRRYSQATVKRLSSLKRLVRAGHRISDIAGLSDEELQSYIVESGHTADPKNIGPLRIAVLGATCTSLAKALRAHPDVCQIVMERAAPLPIDFNTSAQPLDGLLVDIASVTPAITQQLIDVRARFGQMGMLLIYGFARERDLQVLRARGIQLARAPATTTELLKALQDFRTAFASAPMMAEPTPPKFSAAQLAELASLPTEIDCQCPQHLATLLANLIGFEQYSADCENRNEADAALHALLCQEVGRARQIIENNLQHVIDAEGIVLTNAPQA